MFKKSILAAATAIAFSSGVAHAANYVVIGTSGNVTKELSNVNAQVVSSIPEINVHLVSSNDPNFIATAKAIKSVAGAFEDYAITLDDSVQNIDLPADTNTQSVTAGDEWWGPLQWGIQAINAQGAWAKGATGAGVRVAVLDSGIDSDHPDLIDNLNMSLATSFVDGEAVDQLPNSSSNHGTHVAGTIAAADNGFGVIGVAPHAEIVPVKVLSSYTGSGSSYSVMAGIVYAANIDADVINMSLGSMMPHNYKDESGNYTNWINSSYLKAYNRATSYAHKQGTTIIAAAGNESTDGDHDKNLVWIPNQLDHVISISATAPVNYALNPNGFLDYPAGYSNYGQSTIDFAAPGGYWAGAYTDEGNQNCYGVPCYAWDLVLSTGNGGWYFSAGTSMASPHAAGVAALIISANGGKMNPTHVEQAMRAGADDLGKNGNDDFYGQGRLNAGNSIK